MLISFPDRCSALLRVYLLGNHVIPVFLLGLRLSSRPHFDCRPSRLRSVYVAHRLV
jgi:hypothetical protein